MTTTIGTLTRDQVRSAAARYLPPDAPDSGRPDPWGYAELRTAGWQRAVVDGSFVVASGGTTGSPKIIALAPHLGVPLVAAAWQPLGENDVLLNLFPPGRMWGAHYFYNAVALHSKASTVPMGALAPQELTAWADVIGELGVTALAGAPNVLARFAEAVALSGIRLPVRSALWSGEPLTAGHAAALAATFPGVGLWGNYGSIETFVIGVSRPDCGLGLQHLLPGQQLELDDSGALLTRVGEGWPIPAWRFRLGDRIGSATCPCGDEDAFQVLGRADDAFKLYGGLVRTSDLLSVTRSVEGIIDAQVILFRDADISAAVKGVLVRCTGTQDAAEVRRALLRGLNELEACDRHTPDAVRVEVVTELKQHPLTHKVLPVLWRDAAELDFKIGALT